MLNIVRVEKLGDVCAFKLKEIQVVGNIYDRVPEESREDFAVVLNNARDAYNKKVQDAKDAGQKPASAQFKSEAIAQFVSPFLANLGLEPKKTREKVERVVRPKNPKITDAKDPVQIELTEEQKDQAEKYYDNNFSDEILDDSLEIKEEPKDEFESAYIGEVPDEFDMDDDFDFEGLDG